MTVLNCMISNGSVLDFWSLGCWFEPTHRHVSSCIFPHYPLPCLVQLSLICVQKGSLRNHIVPFDFHCIISENQQLRRDNDSLRSELGAMRTAQLQLEAQVERLHQEVQLQYRALRDETDARKLLVVKLNDYHMAQEDALMASQSYTEGATEDEMNDPITLNMALKYV